MEKLILMFPVITGLILMAIGFILFLKRTRWGIHTTGTVTEIKKSIKKISGVEMVIQAPVVKYTVKGKEYCTVSYKFFPEDALSLKKGKPIKIRISRKNPAHFTPDESGGTAEKILISCGIFMIFASSVIYFRYY